MDVLIVIVVLVKYLIDKIKLDGVSIMWLCLLVFCFVYCLLVGVEFWIFLKFKSFIFIVLSIDDGFIGGFMFVFFVNELIECKFLNLWYLDYFVVIVVLFMLLYCGIKIFVEIFVYKKFFF